MLSEEDAKSKFETSIMSRSSSSKSSVQLAPDTAEYNTDHITAEKVITGFTHVFVPEQLKLD